jgi:hypothetical protein
MMMNDDDIKKVQMILKRAGYYIGAIDGKFGPMSRAALDRMFGDYDLKPETTQKVFPMLNEKLTLRQQQSLFVQMVAKLINFAYENGYELTFGDAYRDPRVFGLLGERKGYGAASSFHKQRLAIDLNLFKDGKFLATTEAHKPLGDYWKSIGGTWGGDFKNPDGNHYSLNEGR